MSINVDLSQIKSAINDSFYPLISVKERNLILRGGRGSGKSHFVAQKIILRCMFAEEKGIKHRILCLRKTSPSVRSSVFRLLKFYISQWGLDDECQINKTDMSFYFKNGSEIFCSGLDQPEKIKSYEGTTSAWMEEAVEFTLDDYLSLNMILRGETKDYYQVIMSFNPSSKNTWIYDYFFLEEKADTFYHHSTFRDNKFLDAQFIETLNSIAKASKYHEQVWLKGEWGVLEGLIYPVYEKIPEFPSKFPHLYGCDFGFSHATAVTRVWKVRKDLYLEEKLYRKEMTNDMLIAWIKNNLPRSAIVVCDSAEPQRLKELQIAEIKAVPARKEKNSVMDGIDYIQRHSIKIVEPSVNLVNEISGYSWKKDRQGKPMDEPIKVEDHAMDSFRYPVWQKWGYNESSLQIVWV